MSNKRKSTQILEGIGATHDRLLNPASLVNPQTISLMVHKKKKKNL